MCIIEHVLSKGGCDLLMDCITISTFRSLEQQAIRRFRETRTIETNHKFFSKETFGQENGVLIRNNEPTVETTTNKGLDFYA